MVEQIIQQERERHGITVGEKVKQEPISLSQAEQELRNFNRGLRLFDGGEYLVRETKAHEVMF